MTVTGTTAGVKNNTTNAVTSTEGGSGNTASDTVTVIAPPTIAKTFTPTAIALNATSSLGFTITNPSPNSADLTGVGFSDTLPTGLTAVAASTSPCGGTLTTTTSSITLSGATVTANTPCTFAVTVTGTTAGVKNNTTNAVTSTEGGAGGIASATLNVLAAPVIDKSFSPTRIAPGATTTLTFTLTGPATNPVALTGVAFTDTLPAGLTVANGSAADCGGNLTTTAPTTISLSGASVAAGTQCQFGVTVTGVSDGEYTNTTSAVTSTNGGRGNAASANLTVSAAPTIGKAFAAASVPLNGTTRLTFTITNPNGKLTQTGIVFSDTLPAGLVVANPPNVVGACGGIVTAVAGSSVISLTGGTLAAATSCTIAVDVTGTTAGIKNNVTGAIASVEGGTGGIATASLTVVAPPTITKSFGVSSILVGGSTTLSFTIANPNVSATLTGVEFADTLPTGLVVSTPNGLTGTCGGGTITATAGGTTVSLTGASLVAGATCTFSIDVTATAGGDYTNTTGAAGSANGGSGAAATARLIVSTDAEAGERQGYWMVASDGGVFPFGAAGSFGSLGGLPLNQPIVATAATPDDLGYWLVASDGGVFSFGNASYYGSLGGVRLNRPIVAIGAMPDGLGYWLIASDGGVFSFGSASYYGSTGSIRLNRPVIGIAVTPTGHGYWLVASDGGIFPFGDAVGYGSLGGVTLNKPIVAMAATRSGLGYWMVAADGGIFSFGDATWLGSLGDVRLNAPITAITTTPTGLGYWLFATDGGVFTFGDATWLGSLGAIHLNQPVIAADA